MDLFRSNWESASDFVGIKLQEVGQTSLKEALVDLLAI